jgi:hypothetical protein
MFAPDYSATVAATKCELTPHEHSMYIRFLCSLWIVSITGTGILQHWTSTKRVKNALL